MMKGIPLLIVLTLVLPLILCIPAAATLRQVNVEWKEPVSAPEGLEQDVTAFTSITDALSVAEVGDTIVVHAGIYDDAVENFPIIIDKDVIVRSASETEKAVIIGSSGSIVFEISADGAEVHGLSLLHSRIGMFVTADEVVIANNDIILDRGDLAIGACGIWLSGARHATLEGNRLVHCGIFLCGPRVTADAADALALSSWLFVGDNLDWFSTHSVIDNLVNGSELRYVVSESGVKISNEALGQLVLVDCDDATISGLTLAQSSVGILLAHCRNAEISDCGISSQTLFGVYAIYSRNCRIDQVAITLANHGIDLRACTSTAIANCTVDAAEQGIFSDAGTCNSISNCSVSGAIVGIAMYNEDSSTIQESRILTARFGVALHHSANSWIVANDIVSSSAVGLRVDSVSYALSIARNQFNDNRTSIVIADSDFTSIEKNEILDSALTGLFLSNVGYVSVIDNQFAGGVSHIKVQGTIEQIACQGNTEEGDEIACTQLP